MKLIINRDDIIDTFAHKTGLSANQIEIDINSIVGFQHVKGSINDAEVRGAICDIWTEANRSRDGFGINKITLIKAVRVLTSAGLKDSKDFVEDVLVR